VAMESNIKEIDEQAREIDISLIYSPLMYFII
jgi:hypothetical protein